MNILGNIGTEKYMNLEEKLKNIKYPLVGKWRNNFHIEMPFGLINDPCGLVYQDGVYKIFYQWNPLGCEHKTKHWGLVETKDFINYSRPQLILKPVDKIDKDGCYTGSAAYLNGRIYLFYTGNVRINSVRFPHQNMVVLNENNQVEQKISLIDDSPMGFTDHFRDPYFFKDEDNYYFIVGGQSDTLKGRIVLYRSTNLYNWQYLGIIKTSLKDFGRMWECPNYFKLDNTDILAFCPQGLSSHNHHFQNLHQSGYLVGKLDIENMNFEDRTKFEEFDYGFDFYAPQIFNDNKRVILIGWAGMPENEDEYLTIQENYIYSLTLPRELSLINNHIYQKPIDEIYQLRKNKIFCSTKKEVFKYDKRNLEVLVELDKKQDWTCTIIFSDGYLKMAYFLDNDELVLDRNHLFDGKKGIRRLKMHGEAYLKLDIFIDISLMEIYINDGKYVMTSVYYTMDQGIEISMSCYKNLTIWDMGAIIYNNL